MKKNFKNWITMLALVLALVGTTGGVMTMLQLRESYASGWFDPVFYAQTYPDVAAAFGTDANVLYAHYILYGQKEGRIPYAGGQPGEAIDGILGAEQAQAQPQAPAADAGANQLVSATGLALPSPENPKIVVPCPGSRNDVVYDLSNWNTEQWNHFYEMQAKFDATDYVKVGWTEEQVYQKLMSIKATLYPEGANVGECSAGAGKINNALYGISREWVIGYDKNEMAVLPIGYVFNGTSGGDVIEDFKAATKVGDTVYTKGSGAGHVAVVIAHDNYGITVVESNWNGDKKMHWGDKVGWNELAKRNMERRRY